MMLENFPLNRTISCMFQCVTDIGLQLGLLHSLAVSYFRHLVVTGYLFSSVPMKEGLNIIFHVALALLKSLSIFTVLCHPVFSEGALCLIARHLPTRVLDRSLSVSLRGRP
ncbi:hypothetical protein PAL_GLEAN10017771 [Pteropus alecto]|uniref:Uncharacterized protein n=1 Tax=Pteropus alecto TaxID=9402 RepID=L5KXQ8_PTEAL|nr:hypothetical protein PAL_GLEAN10017771 [Pteropus alecto]